MRIQSRILTRGHRGFVSPPPFAFNCTAQAAWKRAVVAGLQRLDVGDDNLNPICLAHSITIPTFPNLASGWAALVGVTQDLRNLGEFLGTNEPGVYYENAEPNNPAAFRTTSYSVPANTPHTIRGHLKKKPKSQALQLDQWSWGGWTFEIHKGQPLLMRNSAQWSQAQEDALHALYAVEDRTPAQDTQIDTIKVAIYEVHQSLDLNARGDDWYGTNFALTFIPEPRGMVHVFLEGAGFDSVKIPSLLERRDDSGTVWPSGPLIWRTYGGAAYWQVGYPEFAGEGTATFTNRLPADYDLTGVDFDYNKSEPEGTEVKAIAREGGVEFKVFLTLKASGNKRLTPFLYSFRASRLAGDRSGLDTESFDTQDVTGGNPVKQISFSYDGPHNRRQATILMRDVNGQTLANVGVGGYGYDALENRLCDVDILGQRWMTNGIIVSSRQNEMRKATPNQARVQVTKGETDVEIQVMDGWRILDETPCKPGLVFDGDYLEQALIKILNLCGYSSAEYAGIGGMGGGLIPAAAPGEDWREAANEDSSCGDVARHLMEMYGLGYYFRQGMDGVWEFGEVSTEVVAAFVSAHTGNPNLPEHRRIILAPLEYIRDDSAYNEFAVEGKTLPDGTPCTFTHRIGPAQSQANNKFYVGRKRCYRTERNEGIRTKTEAVVAGRSLGWLYGRPGRLVQFETFIDVSILPWSRITADGLLLEVQAINSSSIADDRMQIVGREI